MDFRLPEELDHLRGAVHGFVDEEVLPREAEIEEHDRRVSHSSLGASRRRC